MSSISAKVMTYRWRLCHRGLGM